MTPPPPQRAGAPTAPCTTPDGVTEPPLARGHRGQGLVACLATAAMWLVFVWVYPNSHLTLPPDDAYYYLKIAENVASGSGFTFDQINPTNGFHPLWLFFLSGLCRAVRLDPAAQMRLGLSVQIVCFVAGTLILSRPLRARGGNAFLTFVLLAALNFYLFVIVVNGQESGLQYLLLCATLALLATVGPHATTRRWFLLGLLAALTTMARLEAGVFAALVIVAAPGPARLRARLVAVAPLAIIVGAYLAWNVLQFHTPLPVSGLIKLHEAARVAPLARLGAGLTFCAALTIYTRLMLRDGPRATTLRLLLPLVGYVIFLQAFAYCGRGILVEESWTLVPQLLLLTVVMALAWERVAKRRAARVLAIMVLAAYLAFTGRTWAYRMDPSSFAGNAAGQRTGEWLSRHAALGDVIAGWDCGLMSAFSQRRFINLEGLANSFEFKQRYLDPQRLEQYLRDAGSVAHLALRVPTDSLHRQPAVSTYEGVSLAAWRVEHAECALARSFRDRSRDASWTYLVLGKHAGLPTLAEAAPHLCPQ